MSKSSTKIEGRFIIEEAPLGGLFFFAPAGEERKRARP